jgi:hypothetical protein
MIVGVLEWLTVLEDRQVVLALHNLGRLTHPPLEARSIVLVWEARSRSYLAI